MENINLELSLTIYLNNQALLPDKYFRKVGIKLALNIK